MPDGKEYPLLDTVFPTVDWEHPYELTQGEAEVMERLKSAFRNCEKLQKHMGLLLDKGGLYRVYNGNLLFHGSVPLNEDGASARCSFTGKPTEERRFTMRWRPMCGGRFIRCTEKSSRGEKTCSGTSREGPDSPLFGKDKMSTFERYFIADAGTHKEKKNAYYRHLEDPETVDRILQEFGLDPEEGHIINGHVPVHQLEGESPVKCQGKVLVIDGGFSKAYHKVTGIAGYTLIYNSYGLILTAHEPFTSAEEAVAREQDIVSNRVAVRYTGVRHLVGDTDNGRALKERISELTQLLEAYRRGTIKEKQ